MVDFRHVATTTLGRLPSAGSVIPLVLLGLFVLWPIRAGLPLSATVAAFLAVATTQVLPGVVVWRAIRPRSGWWLEDLAIGFAIGTVLAIAAQIPAGLLGWHWLSGVLLLAGTAALLCVPSTRRRVIHAETSRLPWWWGAAVGLAALGAVASIRGFFRTNQLSWPDERFHANYIDMNLHMALAAQLLERGPTRFPWVESEPLGYHYLSHAWVAQVAATSGAGVDEVTLRFMPVLFPVVIAVTVAIVAVRLTGVLWSGPAAALTAFGVAAANSVGVAGSVTVLKPVSPSVAPSVGMLLALVLILALRWRGQLASWTTVLVFVLALAAAGTKGSTTPLVVAGTAFAALAVTILDRSRARTVLLDLGAVSLGLLVAVQVVFRDSEAGLHLSLHDSASQTYMASRLGGVDNLAMQLFASGVIVFASLSAGALGFLFLAYRDLRLRPELWLILGAGLVGCGARGVFAHPGRSQAYFAISAAPLLALGSAIVLAELFHRVDRRNVAVVAAVSLVGGVLYVVAVPRFFGGVQMGDASQVVGMVALGLGVLVVTGAAAGGLVSGDHMRLGLSGACAALMVGGFLLSANALDDPLPAMRSSRPAAAPLAESMDQIRAARWIRDHSDRNDLVMTNRHCTTPVDPDAGCDSRWFLVAAYSQRQVLVEGWTATPRSAAEGPNGRDSITVPYWHPALLRLNDDFIAAPTAASAEQLRGKGVRWIYADRSRPRSPALAEYATLRYQNRDVDVYEFTP